MRGRKINKRELKSPIYIIGEGKTEQYYFNHIKNIYKIDCVVKPSFFGNTSILEIKNKIEKLLSADVIIICVFDTDIMQVNYIENERLKKLKKKYSKNKNVIFSENYPCIEYWFLIHYENIKTHFRDSKSVINYLKRHIKNFDKSEKFLSKDIWVKSMCSEGKFEQATERSRNSNPEEDGSYSTMYKALDVLKNPR